MSVNAAFRDYFGLTKREAEMLERLYAQPGKPCSFRNVVAARVHISNLRQALDAGAIDTLPGGYVLTDDGLTECDRAVSETIASLQKAISRGEAA